MECVKLMFWLTVLSYLGISTVLDSRFRVTELWNRAAYYTVYACNGRGSLIKIWPTEQNWCSTLADYRSSVVFLTGGGDYSSIPIA